ncbi:hypothetical protein BGX29_001276 [Mortierella sp. GBA35]|nr:hypothetical protein BGX29_001276 [Mortierella sp. GBA35]
MSPTTDLDNDSNSISTNRNEQHPAVRSRPPTPHNSSQSELQPFDLSSIADGDRALVHGILSKIAQLDDAKRLQRQIVVLFSEKLSPILKYHAELISEMLRVLPTVENTPAHDNNNSSEKDNHNDASPDSDASSSDGDSDDHGSRVLAVVLSPKSNAHNLEMLAEPFHLDLFYRRNLAEIQVTASPSGVQSRLLLDDSWARMQTRAREARGTDAAKVHYVQMLTKECERLETILNCAAALSPTGTGPLELHVVMEQLEAELYGVAEKIPGKVIFIVSKDRDVRPKSVALKTNVHWLDRVFLRAGYSEEWVRSNLIPLYIQLPGEADKNLDGQRPESRYRGSTIHLSRKRPEEALVRVKVRQGLGAEVLEASVLGEIERTKIFEMQAIRKPSFLERLGAMSLAEEVPRRGHVRGLGGDGNGKGDDEDEDTNPFL